MGIFISCERSRDRKHFTSCGRDILPVTITQIKASETKKSVWDDVRESPHVSLP